MTTLLTDNRYYFAQAYGQGTYSSCNYNDSVSCTTSGGSGSGSSSSGTLTNTGIMVLLIVSIACLIIFIALIVRFWRRPKRAKSLDSAEQDVLQSEHKHQNK